MSATWTMAASPTAPPPPVVAAPITSPVISPADQLRSLRALLDDGVISQAEYDAKKAEMLAQM